MKYTQIAGRFYNRPIYATQDLVHDVEVILDRAESGISAVDIEAIRNEARINAAPVYYEAPGGTIAHVSMLGPLVNRQSLMTDISGMTAYESLGLQMRDAADDPKVTQIVLEVDSPGGEVNGVDAAAEAVKYAASKKKVTAVASDMMASAAYLVASGASEIVVSGSSSVGSIGVIAAHRDSSSREERLGVKTTYITAGKHKGATRAPLTDESKAALQREVDEAYDYFVEKVSANRNISLSSLKGENQDGIADGSVYMGRTAISLGLADRLGTLYDVLEAAINTHAQATPMFNFGVHASGNTITVTELPEVEPEADVTADVEVVMQLTEERDAAMAEVEKIRADYEGALQEIEAMKVLLDEADAAISRTRAERLVDSAVREGKILSGNMEEWVERAVADYGSIEFFLSSINPGQVVPVGSQSVVGVSPREEVDMIREKIRKQLRGE